MHALACAVLTTHELTSPLSRVFTCIAFPTMTFIVIILFGMSSVAREIQDPFGFDDNDLNVQGYESQLFYNAQAVLDGPLRIRTRDFASTTTSVRTEDGLRRLDVHDSGASEYMGVEELDAGLETKENLWSLSNIPWKIHGKFSDMTMEERRSANTKNNALRRLEKKHQRSTRFKNSVAGSKSQRDINGDFGDFDSENNERV